MAPVTFLTDGTNPAGGAYASLSTSLTSAAPEEPSLAPTGTFELILAHFSATGSGVALSSGDGTRIASTSILDAGFGGGSRPYSNAELWWRWTDGTTFDATAPETVRWRLQSWFLGNVASSPIASDIDTREIAPLSPEVDRSETLSVTSTRRGTKIAFEFGSFSTNLDFDGQPSQLLFPQDLPSLAPGVQTYDATNSGTESVHNYLVVIAEVPAARRGIGLYR